MNDKELFAKYIEKMDSFDDENFSLMAKDIQKGKNSYLRMKFKGSSIFNPEWIRKIEDCLYELGQIVNNPREVTTEEGSLTPIELARKVNAESVQHLASHSQYVKDIDEEGNVIPAKILGQFTKEELHTYENRFIATFIRRLILFIEKRHEFIKETVNLDEKDIMYVKNHSIVNGQEVEIETKISVKRETEDDLTKTAKDYIQRIEKLKEYVTYYYNSPFMKEFKTEKNVRKPIIMTNILRKNPLYHKCLETFLFIEKFDSLGVTFKVDRNFQAFNENERKSLAYIMATNLLSLESTEEKRSYKKTTKVYKPRLLNSIDDEAFTYGDLVRGPIEFVRADETYLKYLEENQPFVPVRPNAAEKIYYEDEINEKKYTNNKIKEIESLLSRVRRQIRKYEKLFNQLIAQRNEEEAKEAKAKLDELRAQEQSILDKRREEIIKAAKALEISKSESKKEEEVAPVNEPVVEETPLEEPQNEEIEQEEPAIVEEQPIEEEVIEEQPVQEESEVIPEAEPAVEEEPLPEPEPVIEEAPVVLEEPVEESQPAPVVEEKVEEPVVEQPKEEKPTNATKKPRTAKKSPKKAPAKKAAIPAKKEKKEPVKEEVKPEPKKEAKPKKTPKAKPVKKEPVKKDKKAPKVKAAPAPKPVKEKPVKKEPTKKAPVKKPAKPEREAIPGKFIVKTEDGYYVNQRKLSKEKGDAFIFDDFNKAQDIKSRLGGKIVKL